jgi:hypothetical protein
MLRNLTLIVAAALGLSILPGRGDEPKPQGDGIKAEVTGTLRIESGRSYFISVKPTGKTEPEMRVWVSYTEDKVLLRKLDGLNGKQVFARGKLRQMPEGQQTSVPPLGMYMGGFEIEEAGIPWSEAVEGLQCRLRADRAVWKVGELPTFRLDVRDLGKRDLEMHAAQAACKLEIDGAWFDWQGPVSILGGTWPAGREYEDFEVRVTLEARWERGNKPIELKPGKHKVRVAYVTLDRKQPVRVVSNAVEIQIDPPPGK